MRGRARTALVICALVAGALVGLAPGAAVADVGDGLLSCNRGEICFNRDVPAGRYQKHFWYNAEHSSYQFTNVSTGACCQGPLRDNADTVKNRDTTCYVLVVDDRGIFPDDSQRVPINHTAWFDLASSIDNENDRHVRCG
jgi:transposase